MAHVQIRPIKGGGHQVMINGVDFSMEVYRGTLGLVMVGEDDPATSEIGLQLTISISQLDLDNETAVKLTDNFLPAAAKVRAIQGVPEPSPSIDERLAMLQSAIDDLAARMAEALNATVRGGRR